MKKTGMALMVVFMILASFTKNAQANDLKKVGKFVEGAIIGFIFHEAGHQWMAAANDESLKWSMDTDGLKWNESSDSILKHKTSYLGPRHEDIPEQWAWRDIWNPNTGLFEKKYIVVVYRYRDQLSTPESIKEREKSIFMGGVLAQVTTSEMLLQQPDLRKNPFKKGWLAFNSLNYVVTDRALGGGGDIQDIKEYAGASGEKTRDALIAYSIFTAWRYTHPSRTEALPEIKVSSNSLKLEWKLKF